MAVCNCNLNFLPPSRFFTCVCIQLLSFLFRFQVNSEQRTMNTEQRTNLKFLVRSGKTLLQALEMLKQVYGDNEMSRTRIFEWHMRFKERREMVEDNSRSRRPWTNKNEVNVKRIKKICVAIVSWLFEWSQVSWTWKKTVFGRLSPKIWACGKSAQKCCQGC